MSTRVADCYGEGIAPVDAYRELARRTAWEPGLYAQAKHHAALQLVELLETVGYSEASAEVFLFWDGCIAGLEAAEDAGITEDELRTTGETIMRASGLSSGNLGQDFG